MKANSDKAALVMREKVYKKYLKFFQKNHDKKIKKEIDIMFTGPGKYVECFASESWHIKGIAGFRLIKDYNIEIKMLGYTGATNGATIFYRADYCDGEFLEGQIIDSYDMPGDDFARKEMTIYVKFFKPDTKTRLNIRIR